MVWAVGTHGMGAELKPLKVTKTGRGSERPVLVNAFPPRFE